MLWSRQGRPLLACYEYAHQRPLTEGRQEASNQPCPAKSLRFSGRVGLEHPTRRHRLLTIGECAEEPTRQALEGVCIHCSVTLDKTAI